ncbi:MAG: hypothetical protein QOE83_357, partial [Actinomycetota bacterium]|nr:hypothetical protein [Actinomycetota bacterium]
MQTEVDPGTPTGNLLLDAIPQHERTRLLEGARLIPLEVGRVLFYPGDPVDYVAFPIAGTLSLIAHADSYYAVEAATIGLEG